MKFGRIFNKLILCFCLSTFIFTFSALAQNLLKPGDKIRIWVKGEPELSLERIIKPNGFIDYPLIGEIKIVDLTPSQAAKSIAKALDDGYLRDPLVQVTLLENNKVNNKNQQINTTNANVNTYIENNAYIKQSLPIPLLVTLVNKHTNKGIANAHVFLNNRIYQSNRKGQVLLYDTSGMAAIFADGYELVQENIENIITNENSIYKIYLNPVSVLSEKTIKVLNSKNNSPIPNVIITIGITCKKQIITNLKGEAKIPNSENSEYIEISLSKRGFVPKQKIVNFIENSVQSIYLEPIK